jgi:hypothetical protein
MTDCIDHGRVGNKRGYSSCWFQGGYSMLHRKAYCIANGVTLASIFGVVIRHTCDNPRCINQDHLVAGDQIDNVRDTLRQANTRVTTRVLTHEEIDRVRAEYTGTYGEQTALAKQYGISRVAMHQILRSKRR